MTFLALLFTTAGASTAGTSTAGTSTAVVIIHFFTSTAF
jgi:hypothetical protein